MEILPVLAPRAALTKQHMLGGLKQLKLTLSELWRPEARNEGVGWATLPPIPPGIRLLQLLLALGDLWATLGIPQPPAASLQSLPPLSSHSILPEHLCLHMAILYGHWS